VLPLLPVYLLCALASIPVNFIPHMKCCSVPTMVQSALLMQGLRSLWDVHGVAGKSNCSFLMGQCWYLTAQVLFVVCFALARRHLGHHVSSCIGNLSATKVASAIFLVGCCEMLAWKAWWHVVPGSILFAPLHLPTFAIGALVGQACLHVKLSRWALRGLAIACDGMVLALCYACSNQRTAKLVADTLFLNTWLLALVVFGLCRTRCCTSRLLSMPSLSSLGIYSFAIYMCHWPIINWASFALTHRSSAGTLAQLLAYDYASLPCNWEMHLSRMSIKQAHTLVPPFTGVSVLGVVLCVAAVLTHGVHVPCQRLINSFLSMEPSENNAEEYQRLLTDAPACDA